VQAAPTGFSAIITPSGEIVQRAGISEQRVLATTIQRRAGLTWATRLGDWPALILATLLIALGWFDSRRNRHRIPMPISSSLEG
jgi:apolipoprotein N-acyltransferase